MACSKKLEKWPASQKLYKKAYQFEKQLKYLNISKYSFSFRLLSGLNNYRQLRE